MSEYLFTSESVASGHPDKLCDTISDSILDLYLSVDPYARVACETLATTNLVVVAGEIRTTAPINHTDIENKIRSVIKSIGYEQEGFDWKTVEIQVRLHEQSPDIALGVDAETNNQGSEGAGDQGLMFGYACDETPTLMPAPIYYSHEILKNLETLRRAKYSYLGPDAKSQVTFKYKHNKPSHVDTIVVSTQHSESATKEMVETAVMEAIHMVFPALESDVKVLINPTGRFVIGGPDGDTGLTGRKIIVDTYGGAAPHGGGAFSGKDPTKVDRSAAYAARYIAKNIVAADLAKSCTVQLAYAIGVAKPVSIAIDFHNDTMNDIAHEFAMRINEELDLTPGGIIKRFNLRRPIYAVTSSYGHFGREPEYGTFPWEELDSVQLMKNIFMDID